ncbi:MAG: hypothetical protein WBE92_01785, partial [Steroidobacteraceae bacterium]
MYAPPSSPQSIGGVLDDALRLFRIAFGRCWVLAIIPGLILIAYESAFPVPIPGIGTLGRQAALQAIAHSPRAWVLDLLSTLLTLTFQSAVMVREIAIRRGDESCTLTRALDTSVRRLPGMILGTVLFGLAIGGGIVLLIVPGLWLLGRLQLWSAALFVEDVSATAALGLSWRLTRSHWWRAAAILTVAVIIILVLTIVFTFIGGLLAGLSHARETGRAILLQVFSLGAAAIS